MKQNDAPFSLAGLFVDSDDENTLLTEDNLYQYESQDLLLGDLSIQVTQSAFHPTNANKVWPGTYILVDYMLSNWTRLFESDKIRLPATTTTLLAPTDASCTLELGAATGALSIFLKLKGVNVITSDYDDGGQIENSILHNMAQNGARSTLHIPHSWGTSWHESFSAATKRQLLTVTAPDTTPTDSIPRPKFACKLIVASDILLYVSAYAALVDTLLTLFRDCGAQEFLMAWNRRIADSAQFFALMRSAGFTHSHHGKGVHSFFLCEDFGRTPAEGEKEEPPREDGSAKAMSSSINDLPTLFDP